MARTAILVYAINLIELGQGEVAVHFELVVDANCRLVAPPPTRRTVIGGYPKVGSYDMLGEQLHCSNPVKQGENVSSPMLSFVSMIISENIKIKRRDQDQRIHGD